MDVLTLARSERVATKRGRPGKPSGAGKLVRIDPAIVTMAQALAKAEGVSLADYLSDLLRPAVSRAYAQTLKRLEQAGLEGSK